MAPNSLLLFEFLILSMYKLETPKYMRSSWKMYIKLDQIHHLRKHKCQMVPLLVVMSQLFTYQLEFLFMT
jgi:hypothetical protein